MQITENKMLSSIRLHSKFRMDKKRFPKVMKVIDQFSDPYPDFVKRRIKWAVNEMVNRGDKLSVSQLHRVASLNAQVI